MYLNDMEGQASMGLEAASGAFHQFLATCAFDEVGSSMTRITRSQGTEREELIQERLCEGHPPIHVVLEIS